MIVEMRTYTLKPRTPPIVEERFAAALPERIKVSPLAGFFHSEVGTLNQIIHLWPYESLAHREQVRAAKYKTWPPDIGEFIVEANTKILNPAPFSPPLGERQLGKLYEIRTYTCRAWTIPKMIERWSPLVEARIKLSPMVGCWFTDIGPLNQWVHIWAYKDAAERQRVRAESLVGGAWPPDTAEFLVKQENMFASPAPFSPLR